VRPFPQRTGAGVQDLEGAVGGGIEAHGVRGPVARSRTPLEVKAASAGSSVPGCRAAGHVPTTSRSLPIAGATAPSSRTLAT
jgi:hypothetical protein